jgi:eukaryotic-like serine/threonine-protein kinase
MPIFPGRRLGPYEILSAIGAGGMGEVYKARDTRLDRNVAIKVLPAHLADRAVSRERFEREAKTIAGLNHPHICTLFDTGHQDDIDFLVMEYIEGETLAQRLQKGALPIQQVLQYAIEIADALDKAHRKGITHRDLKPGNIMLTKSGTKLLDFGLAKLAQEAAPATPDSQLPTMQNAITGEGTILGTLQYMAPEQVEAKEVDARTDIFAFGAVVYEMATGKKAFEGKSSASVMAKILEVHPPSMSSLQPMTPPALDRVIKTCLAKDPDERWQTAGDLCRELRWIAESSASTAATSAAPAERVRASRRWAFLAGLAGLVVATIAGFAVWMLKPAPPKPVTRTIITLPPGDRLVGPDQLALALSPDGKQLAYAAIRGITSQLYLRSMDSQEARPIPGTEGASEPFFSPDGQWIGFFAGGRLRKVSVSGGAAVTLGDAGNPFGSSWSSQGIIAYAPSTGFSLLRLSEAGGASQPLIPFGKGETSQLWPQFLPGGEAVLFVGGNNPADSHVAAQVIATGRRLNLAGGTQPRYAASGHLIFAQGGTLMAVPFDPKKLEVMGTAVPVVQGVATSNTFNSSQYSISDTGSLVYVSGGSQTNQRRMVWVSRRGTEQPLPAPPRPYDLVSVSPDGRRVAVEIENQIWLYDLARDTLTRFTFEGTLNQSPVWTPDGKRIVFRSNKEGVANVFWQRADGSGGLERLGTGQYGQIPRSLSPDGQFLAYHENNPKTQKDIWVVRLSDHKSQPFLVTPFSEGDPTFSPDGHWLAYVSNESGRPEVYVQPFPGPGGKWQISTEGGTEPAWNRNGKELFYRNGNKMMALDVTTQPGFSPGKPRMLFEGQYSTSDWPLIGTAYDVSPDGQRFLMVKATEQAAAATQINVVLNWFEELKQKVPTVKK